MSAFSRTAILVIAFMAFSLVMPVVMMPGSFAAIAQNLNVRKDAPPKVKAKKNRIIPHARNVTNSSLNHKTIKTDCNDVTLGVNLDAGKPGKASRKQQNVVVPGDVINVCR